MRPRGEASEEHQQGKAGPRACEPYKGKADHRTGKGGGVVRPTTPDDEGAKVAAALGNVPVRREPVDHGSSSAYLGDFTDTRILAMELGIDLLPLSLQVESTIEWLADSGTKAACHATGE